MKHDQHGLSRRGFVRGSVVGGAGLGTPVLLPVVSARAADASGSPGEPSGTGGGFGADFTDQSAALTPDKTVATACQFCNSNCRLNVDLKAGRVLAVRGEDSDPVQQGQVCVKAEIVGL